ncbi:Hypothetical protein SCLAV_1548 [Streptomyces clavuligerus]|uniref:Uncharacterized protein n=1 Tax=Streptomyces clavuligerus TaxID=1901 RepID=B5GZA5_STRCL|nr:hypothetical protein SSCG_04629 [Streptomyces clavuligerus]EFG06623.1 Hypothetical protein SCLAV_1548 [Streptomyces clavuligerus]
MGELRFLSTMDKAPRARKRRRENGWSARNSPRIGALRKIRQRS